MALALTLAERFDDSIVEYKAAARVISMRIGKSGIDVDILLYVFAMLDKFKQNIEKGEMDQGK